MMRGMILASSKKERKKYLAELQKFQHADMLELFRVMDGLPVTIRLLDPPLHEFLPHSEEDMLALSKRIDKPIAEIREATESLAEVNPMLGFRGCRLSVVYPEITKMQVEAIIGAAAEAVDLGLKPAPEIMIPLVVNVREIRLVSEIIEKGIHKVLKERSISFPYKIGTMMETPRACLGADRLASAVEFMSFGTNDLTQMTYGFSRDDAGKFIPQYLEQEAHRERSVRIIGPARSRQADGNGNHRVKTTQKGYQVRHLWRARRRPALNPLLPRARPGLCIVQPLPRTCCPYRRCPG